MLAEYLCLGGTEIANNARTYGYATTGGCPVSWFRCEPCESLHDVTSDWTAPVWREAERRRNLHTHPMPDATWIPYYGTTGSGTSTVENGMGKATWTAASGAGVPSINLAANVPIPVFEGETITISADVAASNRRVGFLAEFYNGVGFVASQIVDVDDEQSSTTLVPSRAVAQFTVPATANNVRFSIAASPRPAAPGYWVAGSKVLVQRGSGSDISYFDGDSVDSPEVWYEWAGAADASESVEWFYELVTEGQSSDPPYTAGNITSAPWYDPDFPASARFYGVWIITIENMNSSTRTATVTEGILDGGVVGLTRRSTREMRARALLVADGDDALEYGLAWLSAALATTDCQSHGSACGAVDMSFFAYCPDGPDPLAPPNSDGSDLRDGSILSPRSMHNVTVISGPLVEQYIKSNNGRHVGYIVEWTMVAATPWVFGTTNEITVQPSTPVVIQDVPFNLMPYPSAELSSGTVVVQTNYATNPSLETDITGWNAGVGVITGSVSASRSTEVSSVGAASYKAAVTATNTGTNGTFFAYNDVTLPAEVSGQRFSVSEWGFLAVVSGTAVLSGLTLVVEWRTGTTIHRSDTIGTAPASGGAIAGIGMTRPAGATTARVIMRGDVTSWSTGAVLNLFVDALAFTQP